MHTFVKSALLAFALVVALTQAHQFTEEELHPVPQESDEFLPSLVTMDPGSPPKTGDDEYDDLVASYLLDLHDHEDSEVGDEIGWKHTGKTMCTAYAVGDPHFRSFDGRKYDFQGVGTYELTNCNNFIIQARSTPCGRRRGISCWYEAAVKYTDHLGNTDVIEVSALSYYLKLTQHSSGGVGYPKDSRPLGEISVNGVRLKNQNPKMMKLKNGCYINKVYNGLTYDRKSRPETYIYCPGHNQVLITEFAVVVKRPCCAECAPSLLGNDNCNANDDYKDFHGKSHSGPSYPWGNSFMVDKNNLFGDNAKQFNHPEIKASELPKFEDPEFEHKARNFCKTRALSWTFFKNCMTDAAASGQLGIPKMDIAADNDINKMQFGTNHHAGKAAIARELGKMEVDLLCQKEDVHAAMKKDAAHVAELARKLAAAEQEEKVNCGPVAALRKAAENAAIAHRNAEAQADQHNKNVRQLEGEKSQLEDKKETEDALVREMLNILGNLEDVKSVEELAIDQEALNRAPQLKRVVQTLIEESASRKFTGEKGNTSRVEKLLRELLYAMEKKLKDLKSDLEKAKGLAEDAADELQKKKKEKDLAAAKYADQNMRCKNSKGNKPVEAYRQAQKDQEANNKERQQQLKEIAEEIAMTQNLKNHIQNWNNKKDAKKCPTAVEDLSVH